MIDTAVAKKKGGNKQANEEDEEDEEGGLPGNMAEMLASRLMEGMRSASIPKVVKRRVRALKKLDTSYTETYNKFQEELSALTQKYESLYDPIFSKRRDIIKGEYEPKEDELAEESENEEGSDNEKEEEEEEEEEGQADIQGIPEFWLQAMYCHETIGEMIEEHDEAILESLVDIRSQTLVYPQRGFSLHFHFAPNDYFSNAVLTKTYHMAEGEESVLESCEGCTINWNTGKNVTVKVTKKKQRHRGRGATRTVQVSEPQPSFFAFFTPPKEDDDEEREDADASDDDDEDGGPSRYEIEMEEDFESGCAFRDVLIPHAVGYYTGELQDMDGDEDMMGDMLQNAMQQAMAQGMGGLSLGEDDEGEDEEEEDADFVPRPSKGKGGKGGKKGGKKGGDDQPPECKQQ